MSHLSRGSSSIVRYTNETATTPSGPASVDAGPVVAQTGNVLREYDAYTSLGGEECRCSTEGAECAHSSDHTKEDSIGGYDDSQTKPV